MKLLSDKPSAYICFFVNFRSECDKWAKALENMLAEAVVSVDVLQITGDLDKHEKFSLIRLFTLAITLEEFHPRALFGTGATNTGINQRFLEWVSRSGFLQHNRV